MGCILDFLLDVLLEGFIELVLYGYLTLMSWIVPDKAFTPQAEKAVKRVVLIFSGILLLLILIGLALLIQEDPVIVTIGKHMTYIPLAIIGVQVLLGMIVKLFRKKR